MRKVVMIVLGILMAVCGFYCMMSPVATYASLGQIIGASMVIEGVASIFIWIDRRGTGNSSGVLLASGIISILLGVFLLGSYAMQFAVDMFLAYIIAAWFVVFGISRIVFAFEMRKYPETSGNWVAQLVLGVLIVILGILCIFNPLSVVIGVGLQIGLSILVVGVALVIVGIGI